MLHAHEAVFKVQTVFTCLRTNTDMSRANCALRLHYGHLFTSDTMHVNLGERNSVLAWNFYLGLLFVGNHCLSFHILVQVNGR